jgi:hypothetical protein
MVGKKKVVSSLIVAPMPPEVEVDNKKKRVKSSTTKTTKNVESVSEEVETVPTHEPSKKRKVVKTVKTTSTPSKDQEEMSIKTGSLSFDDVDNADGKDGQEKQLTSEEKQEQKEEQLCESFQSSLQLQPVPVTQPIESSYMLIDAPIILERNVQIPDNVIAPSKQQNNPNNFYLYHELEHKSKTMSPLSSSEFTDLLKSLRHLNQAGQHMTYLLIRTFDIHHKGKQQTNLFDLPYEGEVVNQNTFSQTNEVDIQYDLKCLPTQLQNILKLFVSRHMNMMHELKEYSETSSISQVLF